MGADTEGVSNLIFQLILTDLQWGGGKAGGEKTKKDTSRDIQALRPTAPLKGLRS